MSNKLRVWWVPQVPCDPFYVGIDSIKEGVKLMNTLADYDAFQYDKNIKPDYSNAGGIDMFEDGKWCSWMDNETGEDDPVAYLERNSNEH